VKPVSNRQVEKMLAPNCASASTAYMLFYSIRAE
jgi:hypothetical protein